MTSEGVVVVDPLGTPDPGAIPRARDYLRHLREVMGRAVEEMVPFDEAYAAADWSAFARLPAFEEAHRVNAYGTYLTLEREALEAARKQ